jgi:alanine dehydrogenase
MIIGLPKEIKNNEYRVGLTPGGVGALTHHGHSVIVETSAGNGSGFTDKEYIKNGAIICHSKVELFEESDLIIKVKEPLSEEYKLFKTGQILYTYLHLAANKELTKTLINEQVTAIAYETVELDNKHLPLLAPMSEVAGKMSIQIGANLLQKNNGGSGVLLGGVPGIMPANVVIIGAGVVGTNASKIAKGMGANVTILDINADRLRYLDDIFNGNINTLLANHYNIKNAVRKADLLVGAVLVTGECAPKIVSEAMVKTMKKGSVIVDVAIDQGGSIETIDRVTTHDNPTYLKYGVLHYSVANMPGAVPRTSTFALEAATLPYLLRIADTGLINQLKNDKDLLKGLNTMSGKLTCNHVAKSLNMEYTDPNTLF